jgi:integrase
VSAARARQRHPRGVRTPVRADRTRCDRLRLHQVCRYAVRRGWLAGNPVGKLEAAEKPHWTPKQAAILEPEQLGQLLGHASARYRPLFEFLAYTGLRIGEALGLT